MKRVFAIVLVLTCVVGTARANEDTMPRDLNANGHKIYGLPSPVDASGAATRAFVTPGNCILQSTAVGGTVVCSTLTGFSASPPLLLTGSVLSLNITSSFAVSGGNLVDNTYALSMRSANAGPNMFNLGSLSSGIVWIDVASSIATPRTAIDGTDFLSPTTGVPVGGHSATSVFGRAAGSSGTGADIQASADGQVLRRASGTVGWGGIPAGTVSGTANGVAFFDGTGTLTDDATNASWDPTNFRLGIRTAGLGSYQLHLVDQSGASDRGLTLGGHGTAEEIITWRRSLGSLASPTTVANTTYLGRQLVFAYDGASYLQTGEAGFRVQPGSVVTTGSVRTDWFVDLAQRGATGAYESSGHLLPFRLTRSGDNTLPGRAAFNINPVVQTTLDGNVNIGTNGNGVADLAFYNTSATGFHGTRWYHGTNTGTTYSQFLEVALGSPGTTWFLGPNDGASNTVYTFNANAWQPNRLAVIGGLGLYVGSIGAGSSNGVLEIGRTDVDTTTTTAIALSGSYDQDIVKSGTGTLHIGSSTATPLVFKTNGTTRETWSSAGVLTLNAYPTAGHPQTNSSGDVSIDTTTYLADPGAGGLPARTSSGVTAARTITAANTTVTVTNGDGVAGNPTIAGNYQAGSGISISGNTISATGSGTLGDPGGNGVVVRTSLGTTTNRTIVSSDSTNTVTNGDGVAGNPDVKRAALGGDITCAAGSTTCSVNNLPNGTTQAGKLVATAIVAPATPSAGTAAVYVGSTSKNIEVKNDAGIVNHGIQTVTAVTSQWIRSIAADGTVSQTQPSFTDIAGQATTSQVTDANITDAKLANMPALSFKVRSANSTGVPGNISCSSDGNVPQVSGTSLVCQLLDLSKTTGTVSASQLGSYTNKSVLFWNSGLAQDNANFSFDPTTHSLSLGSPLFIADGANNAPAISFSSASTTGFYKSGIGTGFEFGSGTTAILRAYTGATGVPSTLTLQSFPSQVLFNGCTDIAGCDGLRYDGNDNGIWNAFGQMNIGPSGLYATSATRGFLAITASAGVPTGAPASLLAGKVPIHYDATHDRLYLDNSTWKVIGQLDSTGIVKSDSSGVHSPAVAGTDYVQTASAGTGVMNTGTAANPVFATDPAAAVPWGMVFAYGGESNGVQLPSTTATGGGEPSFWLRPNSWYDGTNNFAAQSQVWEYDVGTNGFSSADLNVYAYTCGISVSSGGQDNIVVVVTKNGVDTSVKVTVSCPNSITNNTNYATSGSVSFTSTDRVGVHVTTNAGGAYSSGAFRATVTLRLRP